MKNKIWITSDTHFGHDNIIKFSNRPFKDVNDMNESLIKSWNESVGVDDDVYHLGDFSLTTPKKTKDILDRLNGKIHLIKGNHEKSVLRKQSCIEKLVWVKDMFELYVDKKLFVMCHYSMRVWNKSHHGSIHLYGHSHDSLDVNGSWGKSMDVGVDSAYRILGEYRPFSLNEIMLIMNKRETKIIDHHE